MPAESVDRGLFYALTTNVKPIYDVLKCISVVDKAIVRISPEGLRFSVEQSRGLHAHAFLDSGLFSTYACKPDPEIDDDVHVLEISLAALTEVLNIYAGGGDSRVGWSSNQQVGGAQRDASKLTGLRLGTTMRMSYKSTGDRLTLHIQEGEVVTDCKLTTYIAPHLAEIELLKDPAPHKIIMRSEWLHEALNELTDNGGKIITIRQSPIKPYFRLYTKGIHGSAQMDYPNERGVLETFECWEDIRNSYNSAFIKSCLRAMSQATKVSLRTDENGTMLLQFMIRIDDERSSFVEFRILAEVEEELGSTDDEGQTTTMHGDETLNL